MPAETPTLETDPSLRAKADLEAGYNRCEDWFVAFDEQTTLTTETAVDAAFNVQRQSREWAKSAEASDAERTSTLLLAATPAMLFASEKLAALEKKGHPRTLNAKDAVLRVGFKKTLAAYNDRIADFARANPDTHVKDFLATAEQLHDWMPGIDSNDASRQVEQSVKGVRRELAFEQMMQAADINYKPGSIEDDLRGIDYHVFDERGTSHAVDVKSSFTGLKATDGNGNGVYHTHKGLRVMSPVNDAMFNDRFFIDADIAEAGGTWLADNLRDADVPV